MCMYIKLKTYIAHEYSIKIFNKIANQVEQYIKIIQYDQRDFSQECKTGLHCHI